MSCTIGTFRYHLNCSILHHLPQGEMRDGYPVIVFPHQDSDMIEGQTYEFVMVMTREATYTIDKQTYRVAHALAPVNVTGREGDIIDKILHSPPLGKNSTIGDVLDGGTVSKLEALKKQLTS